MSRKIYRWFAAFGLSALPAAATYAQQPPPLVYRSSNDTNGAAGVAQTTQYTVPLNSWSQGWWNNGQTVVTGKSNPWRGAPQQTTSVDTSNGPIGSAPQAESLPTASTFTFTQQIPYAIDINNGEIVKKSAKATTTTCAAGVASQPAAVHTVEVVGMVGANIMVTDEEVAQAVRLRAAEYMSAGADEKGLVVNREREKAIYAEEFARIYQREVVLNEMSDRLMKMKGKESVVREVKVEAALLAERKMMELRRKVGARTDAEFRSILMSQGVTESVFRRQMERELTASGLLRAFLKEDPLSIAASNGPVATPQCQAVLGAASVAAPHAESAEMCLPNPLHDHSVTVSVLPVPEPVFPDPATPLPIHGRTLAVRAEAPPGVAYTEFQPAVVTTTAGYGSPGQYYVTGVPAQQSSGDVVIVSSPAVSSHGNLHGSWYREMPGVVFGLQFKGDEAKISVVLNDEGKILTIAFTADYSITKDGTIHGVITGYDVEMSGKMEVMGLTLSGLPMDLQSYSDQPFAFRFRPTDGGMMLGNIRLGGNPNLLSEVVVSPIILNGKYKSLSGALPTPKPAKLNLAGDGADDTVRAGIQSVVPCHEGPQAGSCEVVPQFGGNRWQMGAHPVPVAPTPAQACLPPSCGTSITFPQPSCPPVCSSIVAVPQPTAYSATVRIGNLPTLAPPSIVITPVTCDGTLHSNQSPETLETMTRVFGEMMTGSTPAMVRPATGQTSSVTALRELFPTFEPVTDSTGKLIGIPGSCPDCKFTPDFRGAEKMSVIDVADMTKALVSDDVIISQIECTKSTFSLSITDIIYLKKKMVSDRVILHIQNRASKGCTTNQQSSQAQPLSTTAADNNYLFSYYVGQFGGN